jgi:prepilin-type N-terminal cleavage/methylation domain-containing protein
MKRSAAQPLSNRLSTVPPSRARGGFTLIELLFVVAVIAVLAAISVPNFLEAQTRSKIARTEQHFEILADALEAYQLDQGALPPNLVTEAEYNATIARIQKAEVGETSGALVQSTGMSFPGRYPGYPGRNPQESPYPSLLEANGPALRQLTTPIAYCSQEVVAFNDSFHPRNWNDYSAFNPADPDTPTTGTQAYHDRKTLDQWGKWPGILYWRLDPPASAPGERPCALLLSYGPDAKLDCALTTAGLRLTPYDPTNGTTSDGTLYRFIPSQPSWFQLDYGPKPVPETGAEAEGGLSEE